MLDGAGPMLWRARNASHLAGMLNRTLVPTSPVGAWMIAATEFSLAAMSQPTAHLLVVVLAFTFPLFGAFFGFSVAG